MPNKPQALEYPVLKTSSVVDSFKDWIISQLISGSLKPGSKLPTEAELCENLGISRNSIREAIKQLEAYGIIYIKRPEGTFVTDSYSPKMLSPLLYSFILQNSDWENFVNLRRAIEIGTLYVLMHKELSDESLQVLNDSLADLEGAVKRDEISCEDIVIKDCNFHTVIIEMTENPLLITLSDFINKITVPSRMETTKNVIAEGHIEEYITLHHQLLELIRSKDKSGIEKAVFDHYKFWEKKPKSEQ